MTMEVASRPRMDKFTGASLYQLAFLARIFLAEALGIGLILFVIVIYSPASDVPRPILSGLVFTYVIGVFGPVSGAQVNPAVTTSLILTRRVSFVHGLVIMGGQLVGATLGTLIAKLLGPEALDRTPFLGMTMPSEDITLGQAFLLEMIATAVLIGAVLSVSDEFRDKPWAQGHVTVFPFFLGTMVTLMAATILYVLAPLTGSVIGVIIYDGLLTDGASVWRLKAWLTRSDFDRTVNYKHLKRSHHAQSAEA